MCNFSLVLVLIPPMVSHSAGWQTAVQTLSVRPSGPSEDRASGEQGDSQALADLNTRYGVVQYC